MERSEIFKKLEEVFMDELDLEEVELSDSTTANDIEEWDSLSHVQLVSAIEDSFGVRFSSMEIMTWKNVGELVNSLEQKVK